MATQTPRTSDTPFGLEPNIAAGLAYLFGWVGGLVMLIGGGTNKFVKWSAAQSITLAIVIIAAYVLDAILISIFSMVHLWVLAPILGLIYFVIGIAYLVCWLWTTISGFQGKEVRLPIVAGITESIFKSAL